MAPRKRIRPELKSVLQAAMSLHGHFGPFLTLGVRMGLVGLRQLGVKRGDTRLRTTVMLEYVVPISCVLDGIQTSTKCTVGNTRLTWKKSKRIGAIFELSSSQQRVEMWVRPAIVQELKRELTGQRSDEKTRQIGWDIALRSDEELFLSDKSINTLVWVRSRARSAMLDLDTAKDRLIRDNCSLVVVKNGQVLFETSTSGIRGLLMAVDTLGKNMQGSAVADKIVGEAAAQLCAYSHVCEVYAVTLSQCGRNVLEENGIRYDYKDLVPYILNVRKTDLCPLEKIVAGSRNSKEALERLKKATKVTSS